MTTVCENCGAGDRGEDLSPVHRVYLEMDEAGRIRAEKVVAAVERWCLSCRSLYPHEDLPGADPPEPSS